MGGEDVSILGLLDAARVGEQHDTGTLKDISRQLHSGNQMRAISWSQGRKLALTEHD